MCRYCCYSCYCLFWLVSEYFDACTILLFFGFGIVQRFYMRVHVLFLDMDRIALADKDALEDAQPPSPLARSPAIRTGETPNKNKNKLDSEIVLRTTLWLATEQTTGTAHEGNHRLNTPGNTRRKPLGPSPQLLSAGQTVSCDLFIRALPLLLVDFNTRTPLSSALTLDNLTFPQSWLPPLSSSFSSGHQEATSETEQSTNIVFVLYILQPIYLLLNSEYLIGKFIAVRFIPFIQPR